VVLDMKYLIYGNNTEERQKEVKSISELFLNKGFKKLEISDAGFDELLFLNNISSPNLFGENNLLVLTHCLSSVEIKTFLETKSKEIKETETPIIFVESEFLKKDLPSFKSSFEKISEHKKDKNSQSKRYNIFPLIESIISQDKKRSWLLLQEAQKAGVAAEEIINLLFWQYKTLTLVSGKSSAADLGMKPFVFSKAQKNINRYSLKDLRTKMFSLINLFQEARFEKDGMERIEKLILS
jgi:DNA polymerase III delta subunit